MAEKSSIEEALLENFCGQLNPQTDNSYSPWPRRKYITSFALCIGFTVFYAGSSYLGEKPNKEELVFPLAAIAATVHYRKNAKEESKKLL